MINKFKNCIFLALLICFISCEFLDVSKETAEDLTLEEVFTNADYARRWHAGLFNCITEYSSTGKAQQYDGFSGVWVTMSGETTISGAGFNEMISGFTASTAPFHRWQRLYQIIRDANIFLDNIVPLGGISDRQQLTELDVQRMKAEAKFLIAYSYFSLFELYGPIPILKEAIDPEQSELDFERASVDETIQYIDELLAEVIKSDDLPKTLISNPNSSGNNKYRLSEMVRPTLTAVLALRAKLWVYAASPLFNGEYSESLQVENNDGKKLFSSRDPSKWVKAKTCLEDLFAHCDNYGHKLFTVTDQDGNIDPHASLYELFQNYNDEILWATGKSYWNGPAMEQNTNPRDLYVGWGYLGVSQQSVDAFFMENGLTIDDQNSGYNEDGFVEVVNPMNEDWRVDKNVFSMYSNREPRFYASVGYQGKSWHIQPPGRPDYTLGFAIGEGSSNEASDNPRTGYLPVKFKNRQILFTGDYLKNWARPSILFRLADFYLYYAEVCNEIDPTDPKIIEFLDKVRERAGIPGYHQLAEEGVKDIIGDQILQRDMIRKERKNELFLEGQYFFDERRWLTIDHDPDHSQKVIYGMNMNGHNNENIGESNSFYTRTIVEKRAWRRAMYLYPIPQGEIQKSNLLIQNPLW